MNSVSPRVIEEASLRTSLEAPAEIAIPTTPILSHATMSSSPDPHPMQADGPAAPNRTAAAFVSPPPPSSSDMTPPPSSQTPIVAATPVRHTRAASSPAFASPPASVDQTLCNVYGASENLPSTTDIDNADVENVRKLAKELLVVAQEYRMSAAHIKLQNRLLSLTSSEAVKRAEVEQRLARREVEILQSEEYRNRQAATVKSGQSTDSSQLDQARDRIRELEQQNATLDRRLRRAKRLIEEDKDKTELLIEENIRLKKRIRENREHFTLMLDHGAISHSPHTEFVSPQRRPRDQAPESARSKFNRVESQDPFAALLAADQVLSREPGSVPSTPAKNRDHRNYYNHTRGTHSLSSLPITPRQRLENTDELPFLTPAHHNDAPHNIELSSGLDRRDRDSTISASDVEEALTDEDVPASQASSLATSMLRRHPPSFQETSSLSTNVGKSSTLLQTKLFGQVRKSGVQRSNEGDLKRKPSVDEYQGAAMKKIKAREPFGACIHP